MEKLSSEHHNLREYSLWLDERGDPLGLDNADASSLLLTVEEISNVTWGFRGQRLDGWQSIQRLYIGGFKDAVLLGIAHAVMTAESGRYLEAFHLNVVRDSTGAIVRTDEGKMIVKSVDLGFCQFNTPLDPWREMEMTQEATTAFIDEMYLKYPEYTRADLSGEIAWEFYTRRKWQPWYAYSNNSYKKGLPSSCSAVGNYLGMRYVGNREIVKLTVL